MNTQISPGQSAQQGSVETPFLFRFSNSRALLAYVFGQFYQLLLLGGLAIACYFFINHFLFQSVEVVGVSMVPTLHNADHYFVNRLAYHMREPQRGDIVVIKDPTDGAYCVKRIVAIAGEAIYFKKGEVYVNGEKLNEPYLAPNTQTFTCDNAPEKLITCGKDRYFVLGDNRGNSFDSRYYGPVPRGNILGVISVR